MECIGELDGLLGFGTAPAVHMDRQADDGRSDFFLHDQVDE